MHFNLFTYVLLIILLIVVIMDFNKPLEAMFKHTLIVGLILSFNTNLGNLIQSETSSVGYALVVNLFLTVLGIVIIFTKKHYKFKTLKLGLIAVICVIIGLIGAKLSPYTGGIIVDYDAYVGGDLTRIYDLTVSGASYRFLLNIVMFVIIASAVYNVFTKDDIVKSLNIILKASSIIFAFAFILEVVGNYILKISITEYLYIPVFGYTRATSVNIDRFHGLFKEASHYSLALFFLSLLSIADINLKKQSYKAKGLQSSIVRLVFFLFLLITSTSFIGIFYFACAVLLYIAYNTKPQTKKLFIAFIIFAAIIVLLLLLSGNSEIIPKYDRFEKLFESLNNLLNGRRATFSSEGARLTSMFEMLALVEARPLFGIGAGLADAHSTILSALGTIGIPGTLIWFFVVVKTGRLNSQHIMFVIIMIVALTVSGGNGGILEARLLFIFIAVGCIRKRTFRVSASKKISVATVFGDSITEANEYEKNCY